MPFELTQGKTKQRRGITTVEMLTAAVVLVAVMSFVTTLCFRISLVWQDIGHRRVAVAELSNQLDRLTRMNPVQAREAIQSLALSEHLATTLREPQLSGEIVQSEVGSQINLRLQWDYCLPGKPVELVGWISGGRDGREDRR